MTDETMPSLKQLATLRIQQTVDLKMLEESLDKPDEYRNIVVDAYTEKINKKMLEDALGSSILKEEHKQFLRNVYYDKKRRLSRERPSLFQCYAAVHEYNYDDIQYLILLRFLVNEKTESHLKLSATDVANLFVEKLRATTHYGRTEWTDNSSSGMELYTRKLNGEPSIIKSEANFVVLKDYGGGEVPGDVWEAERNLEWNFEGSLGIVEDIVTELFDDLDEWSKYATYTRYENHPERFPNLFKRFIRRNPGLDGVWEDSVDNVFTHSFFTIERDYTYNLQTETSL
tara:strand:+ start:573 stop:1430 length:858 start_codon:yes stop_codon:yes gene_type:complete